MLRIISGILLVFLLVFLYACSNNEDTSPKTEQMINVKSAAIISETVSIPVNTSGKVYADSEKKLAFKTGGIISKLYVKEGDRVSKGKTLAKLDLSEINANVAKAKEGYEKAKRDLKRVEALYKDNVATLEQKQDSETALEVAASNLNIAKFNLKHSVIKAPENGYILKKLAEEDELVGTGTPVFLFGTNNSTWVIKAGVPDIHINKISLGDSATIKLDSYGDYQFAGEVTEIGQFASPHNGTFEVKVDFKVDTKVIRSGFVAKLELFPKEGTVEKLIPVEALVEAAGNSGFVYSFDNNFVAQKHKVTTGRIIGRNVVIKTNLNVGTPVVTDGADYLVAGDKIKLTNNR